MASIFLSYARKSEASAQRLVGAFHDLGMVIISALFVSLLGAMVGSRFYRQSKSHLGVYHMLRRFFA